MQKVLRIPGKLALTAVGIITFAAALLVTATPANARKFSTAVINGPATVWDGYTCTWTASTDILSPQYEWTVNDGSAIVVIGTDASVSYAYDRALGPHQALRLRVYNAGGDGASDQNLIGIYFNGVGNPDCP